MTREGAFRALLIAAVVVTLAWIGCDNDPGDECTMLPHCNAPAVCTPYGGGRSLCAVPMREGAPEPCPPGMEVKGLPNGGFCLTRSQWRRRGH